MIKVPYWISNFESLITEWYYYVDRTNYLQVLEDMWKYLILLRPRRFWKSLMISMMQYYYDQNELQNFEKMFWNLYVWKTETEFKNKFQILFMEFTGIKTNDKNIATEGFNLNVEKYIEMFCEKYGYDFDKIIEWNKDSADWMMKKLLLQVKLKWEKIYLMIDEYDHFANSILAENQTVFKEITWKWWFLRSFYETIKAWTHTWAIDRLFITWVTPLTLDSLTSWFNIWNRITNHDKVNWILWFTEKEVTEMLNQNFDKTKCKYKLEEMKKWYNWYCFSDEIEEKIYNSDMVLHYLLNYNYEKCYIKDLVDPNVVSDYTKLMWLFNIWNLEENLEVLDDIIQKKEVYSSLVWDFNLERWFERKDFVSLLYYLGYITISENVAWEYRFNIPNYVIKKLFYEYFLRVTKDRFQIKVDSSWIQRMIRKMWVDWDLILLKENLEHILQKMCSNRDAQNFDEKHLKMIVLTLLYNQNLYFVQSEKENGKTYQDIILKLINWNDQLKYYQYLFELKYIPLSNFSPKGERTIWTLKNSKIFKEKLEEAKEQVDWYLKKEEIKEMKMLESYVIISNWEEVEIVKV